LTVVPNNEFRALNIYYKYAEALDSTSECANREISKKVTQELKRRDTSLLDYQLFDNYETWGIVSETKHRKNRSAQMKVSVFATSNNIKKISAPLQSRFFIVKIEPYTYEQFIETTRELLAHRKEEGLASIIAEAVWKKSQDIRDCVKIGTIAKSYGNVEFILSNFLK
jgi:hypothetical protein